MAKVGLSRRGKRARYAAGRIPPPAPKAHHAATTKGRTILQVHGEGPFDITYLNPADDPSKTK
jgi:hypothetical protein